MGEESPKGRRGSVLPRTGQSARSRVLDPAQNLFGAFLDPHQTFSKTEFTRLNTHLLIRNVLIPDGRLFGAWRRNRRRLGECRAGLTKYAAARPLFALWAGRMTASGIICRGDPPRQRCCSYASAEGAPMCTLVLLIRSFPGPPQSTGARHRRARTLFGVKPAGGGCCIPTLGALRPIEGA